MVPNMLRVEVAELDKDRYEAWDDLVDASPHGTIFHKSYWLTACSELLNRQLTILGCFQGDTLVGGCSLFTRTIKGVLRIASSVCPTTPYGGVVLSQSPSTKVRRHETAHQQLVQSICNSIYALQLDHVELINSPDFTDIRPFTWNGWNSKVLYAYYLDTRTDMQTSMEHSTRRAIAKAIKQGIEIKTSHDISEFYELFSMTFRKQGLRPPVPESFLTRIFDLVTSTGSGEMWIAQTPSAETISAHILLWDNRRAYGWSAGSQPRFGNTGATSLLIQEEFNVLKKRGVKEYNLFSGNFPQFAYFASGFNPRLVPYYGVSKSRFVFAIASGVRGLAKELMHYSLPPKRTLKSSNDPVLETDARQLS
jgi:hypothetical protein